MLIFRRATKEDLPVLVQMLADDELGSKREDSSQPLNPRYSSAFDQIDSDSHNELIVAENEKQSIVGMLQLTFIPYLTHQGSWRCLIEGVRVHHHFRGKQIGSKLIQHAIQCAKQRKCQIVQLTTDKQRPDAIRFYQQLGFQATHEGFKLKLL